MQQDIVRVEHLCHRYTSSVAIKDISFEIRQSGVVGLLGSNGAGKSTTMNIMCGVLNQSSGNVWINGINLRKEPLEAKRYIGFLPQVAPLYMDLTVDEYLIHCAHLRLMHKNSIPAAVSDAKEQCGIVPMSKRLLRNLSGGYRQRVGISQAIIHKPKLVVLDEPTNGLDPNQIKEVRNLIKEIAEERAVIFSSHILSEIQATCQQVKMIDCGKMVFSDTMEAFNNYIVPNSLLLTLEEPPPKTELFTIPGVTSVEYLNPKQIRLRFEGTRSISEKIIRLSVEKGWRLQEINIEKSSLDEVFSKLSNQKKIIPDLNDNNY